MQLGVELVGEQYSRVFLADQLEFELLGLHQFVSGRCEVRRLPRFGAAVLSHVAEPEFAV
jgi:hypothetical protein